MGGELSRRDALPTAGTVVAGASASPSPAGAVPAFASGLPALASKAVVVQIRSRPLSNPVILSDCAFESQGGRLFLAGTRQACAPELPS
jgi:hypothetical protein